MVNINHLQNKILGEVPVSMSSPEIALVCVCVGGAYRICLGQTVTVCRLHTLKRWRNRSRFNRPRFKVVVCRHLRRLEASRAWGWQPVSCIAHDPMVCEVALLLYNLVTPPHRRWRRPTGVQATGRKGWKRDVSPQNVVVEGAANRTLHETQVRLSCLVHVCMLSATECRFLFLHSRFHRDRPASLDIPPLPPPPLLHPLKALKVPQPFDPVAAFRGNVPRTWLPRTFGQLSRNFKHGTWSTSDGADGSRKAIDRSGTLDRSLHRAALDYSIC